MKHASTMLFCGIVVGVVVLLPLRVAGQEAAPRSAQLATAPNAQSDALPLRLVKADFNGDSHSDLLSRRYRNEPGYLGSNEIVFLTSRADFFGYCRLPTVADAAWKIGAVGDFDGDSTPDIFWRNTSTGATAVWLLDSAYMNTLVCDAKRVVRDTGYTNDVLDQNWTVVGSGDFNRDGRDDVVWRNTVTGENAVWFMNGRMTIVDALYFPPVEDPSWKIVGVADFNGDGWPDLLWRHMIRLETAVWCMAGNSVTAAYYLPTVDDSFWKIAGVGDFDSDGHPDILWHYVCVTCSDALNGRLAIWYMQGPQEVRDSVYSINDMQDYDWVISAPK